MLHLFNVKDEIQVLTSGQRCLCFPLFVWRINTTGGQFLHKNKQTNKRKSERKKEKEREKAVVVHRCALIAVGEDEHDLHAK